jgi:hypothetical protein
MPSVTQFSHPHNLLKTDQHKQKHQWKPQKVETQIREQSLKVYEVSLAQGLGFGKIELVVLLGEGPLSWLTL